MSVSPGIRLGPYEITAKLGEGGMGEVWRARDTRLEREVAIKVLPAAFTEDPERLARFEREAKVLAQLHHPNIASIFGLEDSDGVRALVMELVEGPTLADRLVTGPIPLSESLAIARQIAEALEEAHEKGIVHRDLKPQNIKASIEGKTKVLDFGLAKAMDPTVAVSGSASQLAASPTLTLGATVQGMILGTAAYMAPEQAKGFAVDKRADIWAFGVVLYEMLTGGRLFGGDSVPETLAGVLKTEIDFSLLPEATPAAIRRLLRRCLERNPKNRLHDIADARIVIDEALRGEGDRETSVTGPAIVGGGRRALAVVAAVAVVAALAGAAAGWLLLRPAASGPPLPPPRLSVTLPVQISLNGGWPARALALSPDGRTLVFSCSIAVSEGEKARQQLCLRRLDDFAVVPLPGTDSGRQPFFSPDGRWVGFFNTDSGLSKVSLESGKTVVLDADLDGAIWGFGSWGEDDRIVFASWNSGLLSVPAAGGEISALVPFDGEWLENPEVLPGARTVLYRARGAGGSRIEVYEIENGRRRVVLADASHPLFAPPDRLLFMRDGVLMMTAFDPKSATVAGSPVPVPEEVALDSFMSADPAPQVALARDGSMAFVAPLESEAAHAELVWVDRDGKETFAAMLPDPVCAVELTADGRRAVVATRHLHEVRFLLLDLERGTTTQVAATKPESDITTPTLLPGDREIVFTSSVVERVYLERASFDRGGEEQTLLELDGSYAAARTVSGDGRWLALSAYRHGRGSEIFRVDLAAEKPAPELFLSTTEQEHSPAISPDGRWLAYASSEAGDLAIFVRSFPDGDKKRRVSSGAGIDPWWRSDGGELYYHWDNAARPGAQDLFAVEVGLDADGELRIGTPRRLFTTEMSGGYDDSRGYAPSGDGQRFLVVRNLGNGREIFEVTRSRDVFDIRLVPRWVEAVRARGLG